VWLTSQKSGRHGNLCRCGVRVPSASRELTLFFQNFSETDALRFSDSTLEERPLINSFSYVWTGGIGKVPSMTDIYLFLVYRLRSSGAIPLMGDIFLTNRSQHKNALELIKKDTPIETKRVSRIVLRKTEKNFSFE